MNSFSAPIWKHWLVGIIVPLAVLACILAIVTAKGSEWQRHLNSPEQSWGIFERFSSIAPDSLKWIAEYDGNWERHGLVLDPNASGSVRFRFHIPPGWQLSMRLWAYDFGRCTVRWRNSTDSKGVFRVLSDSGSLSGEGFWLPNFQHSMDIFIEVAGKNTTDTPQLLLDQLQVSCSKIQPFHGWRIVWWSWGVATIVWWIVAVKKKWWTPPAGMVLWCLLFAVLLWGGHLRLEILSLTPGVPVDPDVVAYQQYAEKFQWFSADTGFYSAAFSEREPLWIAVLSVWQEWFGPGKLSIRLLTVILSTGVIGLSAWLLWRWLPHPVLVVIGSLLIALNPALIEESVRGLRSEAMTLFFIGFLLFTFLKPEDRFRPVAAGVLTGFWALLRAPALGISLVAWGGLWLLRTVKRKWSFLPVVSESYRFHKILVAALISICLFIPHLYGLHKQHGDFRWPSYGYARWNANMEFPDRLGTPGFPSREEFQKSPYAGPRISYGQYLFDLHSPKQVVGYQLKGWAELLFFQALSISQDRLAIVHQLINGQFLQALRFLSMSTLFSAAFCIVFALSFVRLLIDRRLWWAPLMLLWGTYYAAFLFHVRLIEPFRHTAHIYPLCVMAGLAGAGLFFGSGVINFRWRR